MNDAYHDATLQEKLDVSRLATNLWQKIAIGLGSALLTMAAAWGVGIAKYIDVSARVSQLEQRVTVSETRLVQIEQRQFDIRQDVDKLMAAEHIRSNQERR